MTPLLRRLLPTRIAAQLAVVVIVSVALIHLVVASSFYFLSDRDERRDGFAHVGTLVRLVAAAPSGAARADLVAEIAGAFPQVAPVLSDHPPANLSNRFEMAPMGPQFDDLRGWVRIERIAAPDDAPAGAAANAVAVRGPPPPAGTTFAFGLPDGDWLTLVSVPRPPPPLVGPLAATLIFTVICTSLLGLWAMHALVRPLRDLADATRDFDIQGAAPALAESGPDEVRIVSRAVAAMHARIRNLVEDRTRMLAAMGHDLRTPITRLRLRTEFLGDDTLRGEFLRDLALMNEMIEGALTYLREGRHEEALALVDLPAMLQTICDSWSDLGRAVDYDGPDHRVERLRVHALTRALANLIDNAVKYGGRVVVRLGSNPAGGIRIDVEDDGPGIPEDEREAMLRPFVRGDAARNLDDARGFGLGLSIARAVIEGHGGTLSLLAAEPHGLLARIDLPPTPK